MTQRDVSEAAGMDVQQISKYERGVTAPTLPAALAILAAVGAVVKTPDGDYEAVVTGEALPVNEEIRRLREVAAANGEAVRHLAELIVATSPTSIRNRAEVRAIAARVLAALDVEPFAGEPADRGEDRAEGA